VAAAGVEYNQDSDGVPPAQKTDDSMNKAFCREPDSSPPPQCPACGTDGLQVAAETLHAHVPEGLAGRLGEPAHWCPADACTAAADGRSCVARVQRHYLRRRAETGG